MIEQKPVLRWPGSKWRIADRVVSLMPPHRVYCEPFLGSAAVLFRKAPVQFEVASDLDGNVVNLFRVIRDGGAEDLAWAVDLTPCAREELVNCLADESEASPLERARRFLVRSWMSRDPVAPKSGSRWRWQPTAATHKSYVRQWAGLPERVLAAAARLKGVQIDNRPALQVLADVDGPDCCAYVDPPYVPTTRRPKFYNHETSEADHVELLDALTAFRGAVILSGYDSALYGERLTDWNRITFKSNGDGGVDRLEVLWINPIAIERTRQASLFTAT